MVRWVVLFFFLIIYSSMSRITVAVVYTSPLVSVIVVDRIIVWALLAYLLAYYVMLDSPLSLGN